MPLEYELRLLPRAAHKGNLEAVIRLVEKGADIEDPCGKAPCEGSPLYNAVSCRHAAVVEYMLRAGADPIGPGWRGRSLLEIAQRAGPVLKGIVDLLLEYGARA